MPVQCLNYCEKLDVYDLFTEDNITKTSLAEMYQVSRDTITRVIKEIEEENDEMFDSGLEQDTENEAFDVDEIDEEYLEDVEYSFIMTPDSISITRISGDEVDTVNADQDHDRFDQVYEIIINDPRNQDCLADAYEVLNIKTHLENITQGRVTVYPQENRITYTNFDGSVGTFSGRLVQRIIEGARNHENIDHLIAFANKLAENPSNRAVNELYDFLEAADIEIDQDGHVVCFKKVRNDYTDVFSGKFDNSVGQYPSVPRNMVDEDSNQTCSYGLHVCSYSYLGSYPGERIMKVLVHPAAFVSIPNDYYSYNGDGQVKAKARVTGYKVVDEVTDEIFDY